MSSAELKSSLHQLIDEIENPTLLHSIHEILVAQKNSTDGHGHLWDTLSSAQKQEVLEAFKESEDESNLIPHNEALRSLNENLLD